MRPLQKAIRTLSSLDHCYSIWGERNRNRIDPWFSKGCGIHGLRTLFQLYPNMQFQTRKANRNKKEECRLIRNDGMVTLGREWHRVGDWEAIEALWLKICSLM